MRLFARGVSPGPMARSYLRRFRDHRSRAADILADHREPYDSAAG
ncbi:hypothetical protein [Streptomyces sp. cmx-4-7]